MMDERMPVRLSEKPSSLVSFARKELATRMEIKYSSAASAIYAIFPLWSSFFVKFISVTSHVEYCSTSKAKKQEKNARNFFVKVDFFLTHCYNERKMRTKGRDGDDDA
jgi:hypothetical protein